MTPFQALNARHFPVERLLAFDTGRETQRAEVSEAILNCAHNVYIFGTRGSGKTFFQRTQLHYFRHLDSSVLPLYIPCQIQFSIQDYNPSDFALHILNTILIEWWAKALKRPKSDLIELASTSEHSAFDDLKTKQKRFVEDASSSILTAATFVPSCRDAE